MREQILFLFCFLADNQLITLIKTQVMLKSDYKFGDVFSLAAQIVPDATKVEFKHIMNNDNGGVVLLGFKGGQDLAQHLAPAEVMVYVLEGDVDFTMIDRPLHLHKGDFFLMGEGVPHSVRALSDAKVMLVKINPDH